MVAENRLCLRVTCHISCRYVRGQESTIHEPAQEIVVPLIGVVFNEGCSTTCIRTRDNNHRVRKHNGTFTEDIARYLDGRVVVIVEIYSGSSGIVYCVLSDGVISGTSSVAKNSIITAPGIVTSYGEIITAG